MAQLVKTIDSAIGYFPPIKSAVADGQGIPREQFDPSLLLRSLDATFRSDDVQERYVDYPDLYSKHERDSWEREGEIAAQQATMESIDAAKERNRGNP